MHGEANQHTELMCRRETTRGRDTRTAIALVGYGEHLIIDENSFRYSRTAPQVKPRVHSEDSDRNHCEDVGHSARESTKTLKLNPLRLYGSSHMLPLHAANSS